MKAASMPYELAGGRVELAAGANHQSQQLARDARVTGLPDVEGGEAFGGFGLDGYVVDGGQAGAGVRPVDQAADIFGRPLEDRFDPAVG
jgi:hypothetical protein